MKVGKKYKLLVSGVFLLYNVAMYCGIKAQNYYIPDDNGGEIEIQLEGNLIGISGLVYNDNIPSFEDLIDYDEKCISFYPDIQWWRCGNRGDPAGWANSESFLYVRRIMVHDGCEEACIRLKNHPERDPICFKKPHDKKYLRVFIDDACGNHLQRGDVDDEISFSADLFFNNTEGVSPPAPSLHCCISANGRTTWITLTREGYPPGNIAHYSGSGIYTPRNLAGGGSGPVNIKFGASYVFWSITSMQFQEYAHEFEVTGLKFDHEIPLSNNNGGMTHCIPYGSSMYIGEIINLQAGGWPSTLCGQTRAVVTAYDYNSNIVGTSNATVVSGNFETDMSSSGYTLSCSQGKSESFDLRYTIRINGGPEREIRPYSGTHVEVYNGFEGGIITSPDMPADGVLSPNTTYHLLANPHPNLAVSNRFRCEWDYTFTPDNPGPILTEDGITFSPLYSNSHDGSISIGEVTGEGEIWYQVRDISNNDILESTHKQIKVKPTIEIDSPSKNSVYQITDTPEMPEIVCRAHLKGIPTELQDDLIFKWKITLTHDFVKTVRGENITTTISLEESFEVVGPNEWVVDWGTDFCGGNVLIDCSVLYGNETIKEELTATDNIVVEGTNPTLLYVIPYLRFGFDYDDMARQMEVIADKESGYHQFYNSGIPKYSSDGGVGMMQITEGSTDPNVYWNWQANVDRGKAILIEKWAASENWFDAQMNGQNHFPPPTCEEELYNTYCLYNGGYYYTADINTKTYIRNTYWMNECGQCNPDNPEADNVASHPEICKQSGCCYADDAMRRH